MIVLIIGVLRMISIIMIILIIGVGRVMRVVRVISRVVRDIFSIERMIIFPKAIKFNRPVGALGFPFARFHKFVLIFWLYLYEFRYDFFGFC
jgi:hypothetical protein